MGAFFVYILKSAVCLAGFYLFYRLLLSRETFHRFNRVALLGLLVFSCVVPLVEVTVEQPTGVGQQFLTLEEMMLMVDMAAPMEAETALVPLLTWREVLLLVYFLGIVFFLMRHVWSLCRMLRLIKGSAVQKREDGITLISHRKQIAPFSWMKFVVISEKDLNENGREILTHECAHIRNRHSIDLLVADVCIFFQWFNPAAWLLKQELQNIHEYEADESVIAQGVDAKSYQLLLIKKAVGTRLYSMANSFNHSSLKKRITMMMKKKSNPWARAKYLYVLPLAAVAVAAFARPEVSNELSEISAVKVNDLTAIMKAEEVKSVETVAISDEKTVKVKGKVLYADGMEPIANASILIKGTNSGTLTDAEGNFAITAPVGATLKFSYIGVKDAEVELSEKMGVENFSLIVMMSEEGAKVSESSHTSIKYDKESNPSSYAGTIEYDKNGQDEGGQVFQVVEQMPEYPGGMAACLKFLGENIKYPEVAHKNGVQGRVIAQFVVETDGSISNPTIVRSVSPEIDAEAFRVLKLMPKWKPGMQRGKAVRVKYTIPVTFKLSGPKNTVSDVVVTGYATPDADPTNQVFQVVEEMPEFPGGLNELLKFLGRNVKYPVKSQESGEEGRVVVQFIVEKDGSISSPAVVRGISPELNAEAIRVVSSMPNWKPGKQRGKEVRVKFSVPIAFRLGKPEPEKMPADTLAVRADDFNYLVVIDGVKGDKTALKNLPVTDILNLHVMGEKNAVAKFGKEGKNGAVLVSTKKK